MTNSGENSWKKWIRLAILCIGAGMIYQLPFLRFAYYKPLQEALGFTNAQLGFLTSTYGIVAMICYFPGGWLADRVSVRKLLSISYVGTGLGGFYLATYPSYKMALILHAYWGVTAILTFWPALIKATRLLGDSSEQGRLFGFLEGGRGLVSTIVGVAILSVFTKLGSNTFGLTWVIYLYSIGTILAGILTWFLFQDSQADNKNESAFDGVVKAIKDPAVWLIGMVIFSGFTMWIGIGYLTPYLTDVFGASVSIAALLGIIRSYALATVGGSIGGFTSDKVGSSTRTLIYIFVLMAISLGLFLLIPGKSAMLTVAVVNMVVLGVLVYAARGIFFATVDEAKIPTTYTGAAVGLASLIGYLPDAFLYPVIGYWLDNNPGAQGYNIMFSYLIGIAIIGLVVSVVLLKIINNRRKTAPAITVQKS